MNKPAALRGNIGCSPNERAAIWGVALAAALIGATVAATSEPTLFGMPIRPDGLLRNPPADLPSFHQVGVSLLRGAVLVLHYGLWPLGSAVVAACAALLVREVWRGDAA